MNTLWFHGSRKRFKVLRRQKALAPPGRPPKEDLNAIYLTPEFAFALACAVGSEENRIEVNHSLRTIRFENLNKFDPEREIYVYFVDPSNIPDAKRIWIDRWQVAVDMDEVIPIKVERYKASEISKYYNIVSSI